MKKANLFSLAIVFLFVFGVKSKAETVEVQSGDTRIQVAILLDTSNSMDGLIDQAKSRLWDIVNVLTTLKYKDQAPRIELALYEYGNDWLSKRSNYIRQVAPFTTDLDLISEKLFALRTNGGSEYCGAVIQQAIGDLDWGSGSADMRLIYIAGNEEFNQGGISYKEAISSALKKGVYVNTIYCGDRQTGIRELWKDGADRGQGKYFNIDSNIKIRYISTPYDDRINECSDRLNATYIAYGSLGSEKQRNQMEQDQNAKSVSKENYASRAVTKSTSAYRNSNWDLVDKYQETESLNDIKTGDLPKELQGKPEKEIKAYIESKQKERLAIQKEIDELAKKRQAYIDQENKKSGNQQDDDLGKAINASVLAFAKEKGYAVE
ncbi:MAG: VWA domain-containing protein [Candidatus Azobacteroides sp.]|nr:VWA domain-containing protein [Candidatus Azobacteroides sp.]